MSVLPKCSLFLTTYNWPEALELCLLSIRKLNYLPDEVVVADDGSDAPTVKVIEKYQKILPVPVKHARQEHDGYRINALRNLALKSCDFEYIIQIDGDVILDPEFVRDHVKFARPNRFIMGRRKRISIKQTKAFLVSGRYEKLSVVRCGTFTKLDYLFSFRQAYVKGLRGCNLSYWKQDAWKVNGYDEDMTSKGPNDKEFGARLVNAGICPYNLRFNGIQFHLEHSDGNRRKKYWDVLDIYNETVRTKKIRCKNGLRGEQSA